MSQEIECPNCRTHYLEAVDTCTNCGYPFSGTEKEKSVFIGQQILKKGTLGDSKQSMKRARIILWVIGGINIMVAFQSFDELTIAIEVFIGLIFIAFAFLSYRRPVISVAIPLSLLVLAYLINFIIEPMTIIQGLILKIIFLGGLFYALSNAMKAEKIKKESPFLNDQESKSAKSSSDILDAP